MPFLALFSLHTPVVEAFTDSLRTMLDLQFNYESDGPTFMRIVQLISLSSLYNAEKI